jgi:opacity protein-like surface antigen
MSGTAVAQNEPSGGEDNWRFNIAPSYFASTIAGSLTLEQPPDPIYGGNYIVDIGPDHLSSGFIGSAGVGRGRWDFTIGVASTSVSDSAEIQLASTPQDSIPGYYDFSWNESTVRVQYRVGPYLSPYVRIYAGIRWINWKYDLFDDVESTLGNWDESWIDPMLGANTSFGLGAGFSAHAHADAAGFKIGGSELSYTISGGLAYDLTPMIRLTGTYVYKQVSYDNGEEGEDLLVWKDGVTQGWVLGASLSFPGVSR